MLVPITALFLYVADPILGVLAALLLPSVVAMDTGDSHAYLVTYLMFNAAAYFVHHMIDNWSD